jgi:hypothetical protein
MPTSLSFCERFCAVTMISANGSGAVAVVAAGVDPEAFSSAKAGEIPAKSVQHDKRTERRIYRIEPTPILGCLSSSLIV